MKEIIKKIFIIILIIMFFVAFSNSYKALNIDDLAFVVAIGIDSTDTNKFKITFQFVNPPSTSDGSIQEAKILEDAVEATSIPNALNIMNSYLARKLDLSHCRNIIFSEAVAKQGISNHIYTLMNDVQVRPTSNIIVTTCTANVYIKNSIPSLETSITRYYDIFTNSSKYTGYVSNATIGDFYNALVCNSCEPYAILGGVTSSKFTGSQSNFSNDSEIKSGSSPISGTRPAENIGMAVFKDDKLIGELNSMETVCFHILHNSINSFLVSIPNPNNKNSNLDILLIPKKDTKIKVEIINNAPYVKINSSFSAKIYSMNENSDYLEPSTLSAISNSCNKYLENVISDYLYKTALEFKSDINGIGKYALSCFKTNEEFSNYNWRDNYMNSTFKVTINSTIDSGLLLNKT